MQIWESLSLENIWYQNLEKVWLEEHWKDIRNYEDLYKISSLGRIISCSRFQFKGTSISKRLPKKIKKLRLDKDGYPRVTLCKNGYKKTWGPHVLVAANFIPNIENKPTVNHIDGIKYNNAIYNLEWATSSEQSIHALKFNLLKVPDPRNMLGKFGQDHNRSKAVFQFSKNDTFIKEWGSIREICRKTGFDEGTIIDCCKNKRFTYKDFKWIYK